MAEKRYTYFVSFTTTGYWGLTKERCQFIDWYKKCESQEDLDSIGYFLRNRYACPKIDIINLSLVEDFNSSEITWQKSIKKIYDICKNEGNCKKCPIRKICRKYFRVAPSRWKVPFENEDK